MKNKNSLEALARYRTEGGVANHSEITLHRNRPLAIRTFCRECVGGEKKSCQQDITLCTGGGCPLWEWRFGNHYSTPRNIQRVQMAWEAHSDAVKEVEALGLDLEFYTNSTPAERERFVALCNVSTWDEVKPGSWRNLEVVFDDKEKVRDILEPAKKDPVSISSADDVGQN
jgi:hypothetical protein